MLYNSLLTVLFLFSSFENSECAGSRLLKMPNNINLDYKSIEILNAAKEAAANKLDGGDINGIVEMIKNGVNDDIVPAQDAMNNINNDEATATANRLMSMDGIITLIKNGLLSVKTAIKRGYITAAQAVDDGLATKDQLIADGVAQLSDFGILGGDGEETINLVNNLQDAVIGNTGNRALTIDQMIANGWISVSAAIQGGYITANDAVQKGYITAKDAVNMGFLTVFDAVKGGLMSAQEAVDDGLATADQLVNLGVAAWSDFTNVVEDAANDVIDTLCFWC